MNEFWNTVSELEPPKNKQVWTTLDPFRKSPKIKLRSWNGKDWTGPAPKSIYNEIYWALPVNRAKQQ